MIKFSAILLLVLYGTTTWADSDLVEIIDGHLILREILATVRPPTAGDYAGATADWPLDPNESRQIAEALEDSIRVNLTVTQRYDGPELPRAVAHVVVNHADLGRTKTMTGKHFERSVEAELWFTLLPGGEEIGPIPLVFEAQYVKVTRRLRRAALIRVRGATSEQRPNLGKLVIQDFETLNARCQSKLTKRRRD